MLDGHSTNKSLKPLSNIEITALSIFSVVMFYLLSQVFIQAQKHQNISVDESTTPKILDASEVLPDKNDTEVISESGIEKSTETAIISIENNNDTVVENIEDIVEDVEQEPQVTIDQIDTSDVIITEPANVSVEEEFNHEHMQAINDLCKSIDNKLGSVDLEECDSAQLKHSGSVSTQSKPLAYRDFIFGDESEQNKKNKTRIMLIGGIHGDEFSGVSISFKWLHNLAKAYAAESGENVDNLHWRVIPLLNPDGLLQADGESHRMNANAVDLNRNFPTPDWDELAIKFWKEKRYSDKRRYPGSEAGSEIETQWIVSQVEEFDPHAVISIHAPYGILDADGPIEPPPNVGPLQLKILGTYPGSMGRYIGVHKNLSMLTVELKHAGIMPSKKDIDHIWTDILEWINEKVVNRAASTESDAALQSMRHEINGTTKEIVIDKKAGD